MDVDAANDPVVAEQVDGQTELEDGEEGKDAAEDEPGVLSAMMGTAHVAARELSNGWRKKLIQSRSDGT